MKRVEGRGVSLVRRIHVPRIIGTVLGAVCVAAVMLQVDSPAWLWGLLVLQPVIWPFVALRHGLASNNPYRAVSLHLLVDTASIGVWMAVMHFNLLGSVLLLAMTSMNNMAVGGLRLFAIGLGAAAAGAVGGGVILDWPVRIASSPVEVYAALPMLMLYPLVLGYECFCLNNRLVGQKRELARLGTQDGLTGLSNRSHWEQVLAERFARAREGGAPPALMLVDIDHFKIINDTYGHVVGDAALRQVAACLKDSVRAEDFCARYGGDEFGVLLAEADEAALHEVVQRLQAALLGSGTLPGVRLELGISAGACLYRPSLEDSDAWTRRADAALYAAKQAGRRRLVVASGSDPLLVEPPPEHRHTPADA